MSFDLPLSHDISDYPDGIVLPVDKPYRWTSADLVRKLKYAAIKHFGKKNLKVGHAGTLDPLATGVMLVCIGAATKRAEALQKSDKEYIAELSFGATTPSYDLEKPIDAFFPLDGVSEEALKDLLPSFTGEQEQIAPLFSAKSVDGVRAYELARRLYRRGEAIDDSLLQRSMVTVHEIELLEFVASSPGGDGRAEPGGDDSAGTPSSRINVTDNSALGLPRARIRVVCSKGTYIRALARDIGEALGSGAHLSGLVRTRSGSYKLEESLSLEAALALFA